MMREVIIVLGLVVALTAIGGWYAIREGTRKPLDASQLIDRPSTMFWMGPILRVIDDNNTD